MICSHWPDQGNPCRERALFWLVAPDGQRVPGCAQCPPHGRSVVDEYKLKLGEVWALQPIDEYGDMVREATDGRLP